MEHKSGIEKLTTPLSLAKLIEAWIGEFCPACGRGGHASSAPAVAIPSSATSSSASSTTWTNNHKRTFRDTRKQDAMHNDTRDKKRHSTYFNPPDLPKRTVLSSAVTVVQEPSVAPIITQNAKEQKLRAFLSHPSAVPIPQQPLSLLAQYKQKRTVVNSLSRDSPDVMTMTTTNNHHIGDDDDDENDIAPDVTSENEDQNDSNIDS